MSVYNPPFPYRNLKRRITFSPASRSDMAIEEEIWDRFSREGEYVFQPDNLQVEVEDGQVRLTGYTAHEWQRRQAEKIAARVQGVTHVWNEILLDSEVRQRVVQALAKDERTAIYLIPVKCSLGWIHLGGIVPTTEAACAAEEAATSVPTVRGILSLPWVVGLPWTYNSSTGSIRRAFQPKIGAWVYELQSDGRQGCTGRVSQIILDPRSRLLSHLVVRTKENEGDQGAPEERTGKKLNEHIVPVHAIEAANQECVWLKAGEQIRRCPKFQPDRFPYAHPDWRPPFPYQPGTVRWSWQRENKLLG